MTKADFDVLFRLHRVDSALYEIRRRAASLDVGQSIQKTLEAEKPDIEARIGAAKENATRLRDLELAQASRQEKLKRLDKDLYGGSVVNPREVEAIEKEIAHLKAQNDESDVQMLELMEAQPALDKASHEAEARLAALREEVNKRRAAAMKAKVELEAAYKQAQTKRATAAQAVASPLLKQYDAILKRTASTAMAEVTPGGTCGACGMQLPTKTVLAAQESKWVTCESCHRILIQVVVPE